MADGGFGASITFSTGFFAEVTGLRRTGFHRDALETTHMTTSNGDRTFIPSDLLDEGAYEIDFYLVANTSTETPMNAASGAFTITYPIPAGGSVAATAAGTGFLTDIGEEIPMDGIMTRTATLKITGTVTHTSGS
jgi:hypothetical protein